MGVGENLMEDFLSERALILDKFSDSDSKNDYELLSAWKPYSTNDVRRGGRNFKATTRGEIEPKDREKEIREKVA